MTIYDTLHALGKRMISKYGRNITIKNKVNSEIAPPWSPIFTYEEVGAMAVATTFNSNDTNFDGVDIQQNDKLLLLDAVNPVSVGSAIIDDGIEYSVQAVKTIKTGDEELLLKVMIRR